MNTTSIKAFYTAHKTAIIICAAVLVIGSKSFQEGFKSSYYEQTMENSMYQPNGQQAQRQEAGFFGRIFGGTEANSNYNGNGNYTNQQGGYVSNGSNGTYVSGNNTADITSGYYKQQASNDRMAEQFNDYINDQGNYEDGNGNTYKMSSQYSNNYVNTNTNEAIQTNDASYVPDAGYTAVTPSSYSSSSYSSSTTESAE